MKRRPELRRRRDTQRGFSILELMVAMVLGLLVLAAVFVSSAGMVVASRQQRAASLMADDALLAISLMRRDLLMAGYIHPVSISADRFVADNNLIAARPVYGCLYGFTSTQAAVAQGACNSSGARADAIEINFEASKASVDLSANKKLTGCQGAELKNSQGLVPAEAADDSTRLSTSHRYFLNDDQHLACATAGTNAQALVPNVEVLRITYGVSSGWVVDQADTRRPVRYVDAAGVTDWNSVVAVHLCVLMRSDGPVLDKEEAATLGYVDCDGASQTSTDSYLRRAFSTTLALRNRVAP